MRGAARTSPPRIAWQFGSCSIASFLSLRLRCRGLRGSSARPIFFRPLPRSRQPASRAAERECQSEVLYTICKPPASSARPAAARCRRPVPHRSRRLLPFRCPLPSSAAADHHRRCSCGNSLPLHLKQRDGGGSAAGPDCDGRDGLRQEVGCGIAIIAALHPVRALCACKCAGLSAVHAQPICNRHNPMRCCASCSTVAAMLAQALSAAFYEGDAFHPPANIAKMRVRPAGPGWPCMHMRWYRTRGSSIEGSQPVMSLQICCSSTSSPSHLRQAGTPLCDDDRWPWLQRLADIVQRHLASGQPAVLSCSALRPAYRQLLRTGRRPSSSSCSHSHGGWVSGSSGSSTELSGSRAAGEDGTAPSSGGVGFVSLGPDSSCCFCLWLPGLV